MNKHAASYRREKEAPHEKSIEEMLGANFARIAKNPVTPVTALAYREPTTAVISYLKRNHIDKEIRNAIDIGGGTGAFSGAIVSALWSDVQVTNVDTSQPLLDQDHTSTRKLCSPIEALTTTLGPFDCAFIRYVLQYNDERTQNKIISLARELVPSGIVISQYCIPCPPQAEKINQLFRGEILQKQLYRSRGQWLPEEDIISMVRRAGFRRERFYKTVFSLSDFLTDRYNLTKSQRRTLHSYLSEHDTLGICCEIWR